MQKSNVNSISQVLAAGRASQQCIELDPSWWGFGGVHGGVALGLLTAAMCARTEGHALQQVSGRFHRPLREPFTLHVMDQGTGKTVSWWAAHARVNNQIVISASAVFAAAAARPGTAATPSMPTVPLPSACPVFTVPREFVPFAGRMEIRPIGRARPFSRGANPELMAWLRLIDDDLPVDPIRLVVLMDSLAPSYSAVLDTPTPIPTVTFTVTPSAGLGSTESSWVLLRARTEFCRNDGWLLERLDAWAPNGNHLGSGEQLRFIKRVV
ncbi:hypothetical protein UA18_01232 [Burkholderia multivorans]|uniref:Thioesterase family protein n=1 Tax=Burkholderia multivorans TaxID=87883 RepID=A0ABD7LG86_9BURK|nr:hypothetical protein UA18_01232 [Burkholderia multivorans]